MSMYEEILPDPNELSWEQCLERYRTDRRRALDVIREVGRMSGQVDQALDELKHRPIMKGELQSVMDRGEVLAITGALMNGKLRALREWFRTAKAVHEKMGRASYLAHLHHESLNITYDQALRLYTQLIARYGTHEFQRVTNADEFAQTATKLLIEITSARRLGDVLKEMLSSMGVDADAEKNAEALWAEFMSKRN